MGGLYGAPIMTLDIIPALFLFALVSSITPGPNNMMLLASGANFGLRASIPHMIGISLGHAVMTVLVALGLMGVLLGWPWLFSLLKVAAVFYFLYLAWRLVHAGPPEGSSAKKPLSFWQAAGFQWVNPKAWVMTLGAVTSFMQSPDLGGALIMALVFIVAGMPAIVLWTYAGQGLARFLSNPKALQLFNSVMAFLLVASLLPVFMMTLPQ